VIRLCNVSGWRVSAHTGKYVRDSDFSNQLVTIAKTFIQHFVCYHNRSMCLCHANDKFRPIQKEMYPYVLYFVLAAKHYRNLQYC